MAVWILKPLNCQDARARVVPAIRRSADTHPVEAGVLSEAGSTRMLSYPHAGRLEPGASPGPRRGWAGAARSDMHNRCCILLRLADPGSGLGRDWTEAGCSTS